jgi:dUTPase-like protein
MITDIMAAMLESQRLVQQEYGHDFKTMTDEERMRYLTTMTAACTGELHEALAETGWKPWASSNHINREEWMGEMADAWLFFMNLMLAGGMTAQDLIERTAKKQDNSYKRIKNGYDGVSSKCPICRRAYDNEGVKCVPGAVGELDRCAYIKPRNIGTVSSNVNTATACGYCGTPYGVRGCHPASNQGYGWCGLNQISFTIDDGAIRA